VGLIEELGPGDVAIDTAILIYWIEDHEHFAPLLADLFGEADRGARTVVTSALTLLEVLVGPLRAGETALAETYEAALTGGPGIRLVPVDLSVLRSAARLRADHGLRTPDAIQLAAAREGSATCFLTHDRRLRSIPGLQVVQLDAA
jgi:predicted nucleic acid-binding protein